MLRPKHLGHWLQLFLRPVRGALTLWNVNDGENITGWWCNNHLEKYESQWEGLSHILWKIEHVRNHQPDPITSIAYSLSVLSNTDPADVIKFCKTTWSPGQFTYCTWRSAILVSKDWIKGTCSAETLVFTSKHTSRGFPATKSGKIWRAGSYMIGADKKRQTGSPLSIATWHSVFFSLVNAHVDHHFDW